MRESVPFISMWFKGQLYVSHAQTVFISCWSFTGPFAWISLSCAFNIMVNGVDPSQEIAKLEGTPETLQIILDRFSTVSMQNSLVFFWLSVLVLGRQSFCTCESVVPILLKMSWIPHYASPIFPWCTLPSWPDRKQRQNPMHSIMTEENRGGKFNW